jgi:hypothetical protein
MRIPALALMVLGLAGCSSQPRFIHTGGNSDPFVMFDSKTAQACYAGSPAALRDSVQATREQGVADTALSKSWTTAVLPASVAIEERKVEQEYNKKATAELMEAERLSGLQKLPTCRSLLADGYVEKNK